MGRDNQASSAPRSRVGRCVWRIQSVHLSLAVGVQEMQLAARVWGVPIFLILLLLWGGYASLELNLAPRPGELRVIWQPSVHLLFTLACWTTDYRQYPLITAVDCSIL